MLKYGQGKASRVLIDATVNWELEPEVQYRSGVTWRVTDNGARAQIDKAA